MFGVADFLWLLPWFVGFALIGAGLSGICPMVLATPGGVGMTNDTAETKSVSVSTKITLIAFWGLILVGLIFAAILFQTMEESTLDGRERRADNIAYRIREALDNSGLDGEEELANQIYLIGIRQPELHMELHRSGKPVVAALREAPAEQAHTITRLINFTQGNGERVSAELILNFPSLEAALHSQRSPLLLGLGVLLLLFGSVLKGLLDTILNVPLRQSITRDATVRSTHCATWTSISSRW